MKMKMFGLITGAIGIGIASSIVTHFGTKCYTKIKNATKEEKKPVRRKASSK